MNANFREKLDEHIENQRDFYKSMFFDILRFETVNPPGNE